MISQINSHIDRLREKRIYLKKWQDIKINKQSLAVERISFEIMITNLEYQITEKDFLRAMSSGGITSFMGLVAARLGEGGCKAMSIRQGKAADLMSAPGGDGGGRDPVLEIMKLFREKGINRVPVLDAQGRLAGIVSRGDLLELAPSQAGDAP